MHTDVAYNISQDLLWPSQFLEIFLDILRWSTLQKWIRSLPLLSVAPYWKSSNIKAYAKNLSRILANNIDNRGSGISFIIYLRHCSFKKSHFCEINIIFCSQKLIENKNNPIHWKYVQGKGNSGLVNFLDFADLAVNIFPLGLQTNYS